LGRLLWQLATASCLVVTGCTLALQREGDQCETSDDCQRLARGAVCTSEGICEALQDTAEVSYDEPCASDDECKGAWSICRDYVCRKLDAHGCIGLGTIDAADPRERLPIGLLVPAEELVGAAAQRMRGAALTAIDAFNQTPGSGPQLVGVACDDGDEVALAALLDAGVQILIGPSRAHAIAPIAAIAQRRAVLFAPFADAPALLELGTPLESHVVSCTPNGAGTLVAQGAAISFFREHLRAAGLAADQARMVEAISHEEHELGYGFADGGGVDIERVSYDASLQGRGFVSALSEHPQEPSILVAPSGEVDWSFNMTALDSERLATGAPLPFYLLRGKQANTLDVIRDSATSPHRSERAVGLDFTLSEPSQEVHRRFVRAFHGSTGSAAAPGLAAVHDCVYLAVYAALAAELRFSLRRQELSADSLIMGLRALVKPDAGDQDSEDHGSVDVAVGREEIPQALAALRSARGRDGAIDLRGGTGDLDFLALPSTTQVIQSRAGLYLSPSPASLELYCVDAARNEFCDTGIVFSQVASTSPESSRCDCFPLQ
jgi:hypothetical protein